MTLYLMLAQWICDCEPFWIYGPDHPASKETRRFWETVAAQIPWRWWSHYQKIQEL